MSRDDNYLLYLKFLTSKLKKFFESQEPFLFCKRGCADCCKNAQFPYSEVEIKFLLKGFLQLDKETQDKIENNLENLKKLKNSKKGTGDKDFKYNCPFLIEDVCAVYDYRGIICRSFGLITIGIDKRLKMPFCCYKGKNYSNVFDVKTQMFSKEKTALLNTDKEPSGFNVSYNYLTDEIIENGFDFKFGEKKPMLEWFLGQDEENSD